MTTAIVDYGSGNLRSAEKAFERAASEGDGGEIVVTSNPERVASADRVVLPGVGAFADCRAGLAAVDGMMEAVDTHCRSGKPFFGICVGMQLMASVGHEFGSTPGFGWIPGAVDRIAPSDPSLKIPHMGWNPITPDREHPLFDGVATGDHVYFVHSYHFVPENPEHRLASCDYGGPITACVGRDNLFGTQFHPEKSQRIGLRLISNFLRWTP